MLELFLILILLTGLFWLGFHITGALLSAAFWVLIRLPLAVVLFALGLACCVTLLLIPVGIKLWKLALRVIF